MEFYNMKKLILFLGVLTIHFAKSQNLLDSNQLEKLNSFSKKKGISTLKLDSNLFYDEIIIKKHLTRTSIKYYKRKTKLSLIRIKLNDTSNIWLIAIKDIDKRRNSIFIHNNQNSIYSIAGDSTIYIKEYEETIKYIKRKKYNAKIMLKDYNQFNDKKSLINLIKYDLDRVKIKEFRISFILLTV